MRVYVCISEISAAVFLHDILKVVHVSYPSLNFFFFPPREWMGREEEGMGGGEKVETGIGL